ncbi:hypothetical protein [Christiangramia salexigens]|uniref:Uncharacterized protein n=1 Tax=Christiangramia salexigens TaxID=1913577 RepID=A0A1L3J4B5_9FLAO|nr:hypothetical protein [Christiangramia salexigens]APG59950.1 hypothetical protein LPB144_05780 [Christiangramia salexigens]
MSKASQRYLVLISKIIFFYSVFYVIMKILAILQGSWLVPNLILSLPYLVLGIVGGIIVKKNTYNWLYVIAGALLISVVRYYEQEWVVALHNYFG